jgi:hypothetical protein
MNACLPNYGWRFFHEVGRASKAQAGRSIQRHERHHDLVEQRIAARLGNGEMSCSVVCSCGGSLPSLGRRAFADRR